MLLDLLRGNHDMLQIIAGAFASIFVVFCTLPIHEYAHAYVATKLGDPTPKLSGRLTLNPMAHIDWIGALLILLVGVGYAKPVNVNPRNFKNPKTGMALTAIAGPVSNLLMAAIFILLQNIILVLPFENIFTVAFYIFLNFAAIINISLAVFNLLPIPPLDGSRIFQIFLPDKYYFKLLQYERYIVLAVFLLIFLGVLNRPLAFLQSTIYNFLNFIIGLPFRLLAG